MSVEETLKERGNRYGQFKDHAKIAMKLKEVMRHPAAPASLELTHEGWLRLAPDQMQALDTICDKIARIINGDPNYIDNWHDIQGYAKLVEDRLLAEEQERRDPSI